MDDRAFLKLKNRYYAEGADVNLPDKAVRVSTPGKANNKEQNALRWGYETAVRDLQTHIQHVLFGDGS